ncbi:MAG: N-6 DNA methylase [Sulfitobacter sp.]
MTISFTPVWQDALALDRRAAPEFYTSVDDVTVGLHSDAIRFALKELKLAAVFCIEGVPTVGFINQPDVSFEQIDELHRILWNQGLMSLLLVIRNDELTAYSLVKRPFQRKSEQKTDPRLITTLNLLDDALKLRGLLDSTESGRFWFENDGYFDPDDRVDSVLLSNLLEAFRDMQDELGGDAAQALLMQTMFIAYLEDRQIIKETVFKSASGDSCASLAEVLEADTTEHFEHLFGWLKGAFNGNLFNAPCAFELGDTAPPQLRTNHLRTLARFRHGREEMASGQLRLWGYDFKYMSIGLISAVYDRFLKEEADKQNAEGAFYTPMFLADVAVNQLWEELTDKQRAKGIYCDPACGSGIFLVRLFQRLVAHHCREKNKSHATWNELQKIAHRLHGGDINPSAVRVAAFSLYIAMLEQSNPPDLPALIKAGKLLPALYGQTLKPAADFFLTDDGPTFDAIVGNPPWKGRSGQLTTSQIWAKENKYPNPAKDIAWGFVWKALKVVKPDGIIAFLLPAMGILHNTSKESQNARRMLLQHTRVKRIINLSDLCFQLFDGAQRPTAFALYSPAPENAPSYRFEYWVPKADLNLRLKRLLSLSSADRLRLRSDRAGDDPTVFKRRLWTRAPEEKLLQYLRSIPALHDFICESSKSKSTKDDRKESSGWAIGQGFQPAYQDRLDQNAYQAKVSEYVTVFPYLDAKSFSELVLPKISAQPWDTKIVRRTGFEAGFHGPHIIIPQGVERSIGRIRAAYSEQNFVFRDSLQAITVPEGERRKAKVLTAVLNSSLAAWFYFHDTANLGTDRAKVHQNEILKLPFDIPKAMPDQQRATEAEQKLIRIMDREIDGANALLQNPRDRLEEIDQIVFDYYGLDEQDIAIIQDTFQYIIPAMQPRRNAGLQKIWENSRPEQRVEYATTICSALKPYFREPVSAALIAKSRDLAVLKLSIGKTSQPYSEDQLKEVGVFLESISSILPTPLPGNFQQIPDLRFVIGPDMYLVKPIQVRHWLRSTALADAEQIAAELSATIARTTSESVMHVDG